MQFQLTKLHVCTDTKQTAGSPHQRVIGREGDITSLHKLDNLVLLTLIVQLEVLGIEIESGIGIVVQAHINFIAYLTCHVQIDFFVKVNSLRLTVSFRQRGVIDVLEIGTKLKFCCSLSLDANTTRTKDLFCRTQVEVHIGEVELLLTLGSHVLNILLTEELVELALFTPAAILVRGHQHRSVEIAVANLGAYQIHTCRVIVFRLLFDVLRKMQVDG